MSKRIIQMTFQGNIYMHLEFRITIVGLLKIVKNIMNVATFGFYYKI